MIVFALLILPLLTFSLLGKVITYFSENKPVPPPQFNQVNQFNQVPPQIQFPPLLPVDFNKANDTLVIDENNLDLAPPPITLLELTEEQKKIHVMELMTIFDQLGLKDGYVNPINRVRLWNLCKDVSDPKNDIGRGFNPRNPALLEEVSAYLKFLINKMQSGEIDKDKQKVILEELVKAAGMCRPTWVEVSSRLYREFSMGRKETAEIKLLRFVQEYKEAIFLEKITKDGYMWHALTKKRINFGKELGLNIHLAKFDPHLHNPIMTDWQKQRNRKYFLERYSKVEALIAAIHQSIHNAGPDESCSLFFQKIFDSVPGQKLDEDHHEYDDFLQEHLDKFYEEEGRQVNKTAIGIMLQAIGILR